MEKDTSAAKQKDPSKNPLKHYSICSWMDEDDVRKFPEELCDSKGLLKLLQKKKPKGPTVATYYLTLKCTSKGATSHVDLAVSFPPETVGALKEEIEEQCSIPICMQELNHQSTALKDDECRLKKAGVKSGSIVEVTYDCEAEVQKIWRIIKWMDYMASYLEDRHPIVSTEIGLEADMLATIGLNERMCERLALNYFSPVGLPRVEANKRYFLSKKGVSKLAKLLSNVLDQPWGEQFLRLKLLESKLLDALRCFAAQNEEYQKELIKHEVIGYTLLMLTRVKLLPLKPVEDLMGSYGVKEHNDFLVLEMLSSVLEMLWMMRNHKELYTDMTKLDISVNQLLLISQSPSFSHKQAIMSLHLLTTRVTWLESSEDVGKASLVVLDVPGARETFGEEGEMMMMTKYYCSLLVGWLLMYSCKHFGPDSSTHINKTLNLMKSFLSTADLNTIIDLTHKYNIFIPNLLPMFSLLFHPKSQPRTLLPTHSLELVTELEETATRVILFHLQVVLSRAQVREGLKESDIAEYLVCLPWGLPPRVKAAAQELVSYVHQYKPLPVPKLSTMVRSLVAHSYLEFDKLQKVKAGEGELDSVAYPQIARVGLPLYTTRDKHVYVISIQ